MSDECHDSQTGEARKEFVQAMSEILEQPAVYRFVLHGIEGGTLAYIQLAADMA